MVIRWQSFQRREHLSNTLDQNSVGTSTWHPNWPTFKNQIPNVILSPLNVLSVFEKVRNKTSTAPVNKPNVTALIHVFQIVSPKKFIIGLRNPAHLVDWHKLFTCQWSKNNALESEVSFAKLSLISSCCLLHHKFLSCSDLCTRTPSMFP